MPGKIDWTVSVTVAGGPKVSLARSLDVDAYDKVDVTIPKAGGPAGSNVVKVSVQPSAAGKVQFLLITSSVYDDKLTYKVDGGAAEIKLDEPQLLGGDGLVALLGNTQNEFEFKNEVDPPKDAAVQILVGRNPKK